VHDELVSVSRTYDWGTQPDVGLPPSIGLQVHASDTLEVYQPDPHGDDCPSEVHIGVVVYEAWAIETTPNEAASPTPTASRRGLKRPLIALTGPTIPPARA
jgi:hypothetical protein